MKKILIVDDSAFMRSVLKEVISDNRELLTAEDQLEILEADSKVKALQQIKKEMPDVVLLDIVMNESEVEGLELLMEVGSFFDVQKIIMVSSVGLSSLIEECKRHGVRFYLQKPFDQQLVIEALKEVLGISELQP